MNENLKLFRVYDTKTKEYLFASNTKETAKICRDEKEHALPHLKEIQTPTIFIKTDKHYKYRFQIRRAMDHRKGET